VKSPLEDSAGKVITFFPAPEASRNDWVVAILDRCGLGYRTVNGARTADPAAKLPRLEFGRDALSGFGRQELFDFLWAHGAKMEDS